MAKRITIADLKSFCADLLFQQVLAVAKTRTGVDDPTACDATGTPVWAHHVTPDILAGLLVCEHPQCVELLRGGRKYLTVQDKQVLNERLQKFGLSLKELS